MKKAALLILLLLGASQVLAHGYVVKTEPIDGAELSNPPTQIQVWFNEPLVLESGEISMIRSTTGENIPLGQTVHNDNTLITAQIPATLPQGAYIVSAKAQVQSDGHEPSSSFLFWVGRKGQTAAMTEKNPPAYGVFAFFMGLMVVASGLGAWLLRKNPLEIRRPNHDINHVPLE